MPGAYDRSMRKQGRKGARRAVSERNDRLDAMGPQERKWGREMNASEKHGYGEAMRAQRAAHGLTDGLKCSQGEFHDYLARRRAEDKKARGY